MESISIIKKSIARRRPNYAMNQCNSCKQGDERTELIKELHRIKTDIFMEMIESKQLPLRPGVKRLVMEAFASGSL